MITVEELKKKATGKYAGTLKKLLLGENPFPIQVPYKKSSPAGDPSRILEAKAILRSQAKDFVGFGPTVQFNDSNTRRFGRATLPGAIAFDTFDDLVRFIGKKSEADRILEHARIVTSAFPGINKWASTRLHMLSCYDAGIWRGIVETVDFFKRNPNPWVYPRELPLNVPTKFLENYHGSIIEILKQVSPATLNDTFTNWQDRIGLRSSSELVEGRFLDHTLAPHLPQHMLAPIKEWNRCAFCAPMWILITENRTTFLTLPHLQGCLAMLGKGYAVNRLAQIDKLHGLQIFYWGDIDQHGFEILASIRSCLPKTVSCLMDNETLMSCQNQVRFENVQPTLPADFVTEHLTPAENELWKKCAKKHLRLEQEQIPHNVLLAALQPIASGNQSIPGR